MKQQMIPGIAALAVVAALAGCGGGSGETASSSAETAATSSSSPGSSSVADTPTAAASGCTASGLDAMTALSDFQLEMDDAQKNGQMTVDELTAARDRLFNETQAAAEKEDWVAYCTSIDDMRAELGL
jgi:peroxiredoxin